MGEKKIKHILISQEELNHILKIDELFYSKSWREAVVRGTESENFGVLTSYKGDNALLGIYFKKEESFFKLVGSPLPGTFTPYLEPIWLLELDEKEKQKIFSSHAQFIKSLGFSYIEYRFFNYDEAESLNKEVNFSLKEFYNYVLELNDFENIIKNVSSVCKKKIKMAKESEVVIERVEACMIDVEDYYFMLKAVYEAKGKKLIHSFEFFKEIFHRMQEDNKLFFIRAVFENRIISMMIFLYDKEKMVWLGGVSVDTAKEMGVECAMMEKAVKFAYSKRLKILDFNRKGDKELDFLKESFNAKPHKCGELFYKTSIVKSAETVYKKLKRLS